MLSDYLSTDEEPTALRDLRLEQGIQLVSRRVGIKVWVCLTPKHSLGERLSVGKVKLNLGIIYKLDYNQGSD